MTTPIKIIRKKEYDALHGVPDQRGVWDDISKPWKTYVVKKIPVVENFLRDKKGLVVDLGCGSGRNMLGGEGLKYYGVDFSKGQVEQARRYVSQEKVDAKLFCSSACELDKRVFKDEMFDYGLFMATLHCIEGASSREKALKEFYRILKKGAEGLISVWDSGDKRFDCVGNHGDIYMDWREDGKSHMRYYYLYRREELLSLLKKVGFKVLEVYAHDEVDGVKKVDRFSRKNLVVLVLK